MSKLKQAYLVLVELGLRYVVYRVWFVVKRKSGLLKIAFPTTLKPSSPLNVAEWRQQPNRHFIQERSVLSIPRNKDKELEQRVLNYKAGKYLFFNKQWMDLGTACDWVTNPDSTYTYDLNHWSTIPSYSKQTGDIKYVWEKSRFCYLQDIIRYDYHFEEDNVAFVFDEIEDWLQKNPLNLGPNYVCSQETSLRLLNWVTALSFYKNSDYLTRERFDEMLNSIYGQTKHVEANLNFSRYLVRNNHAITECFLLFFMGLVFPHFKESERWIKRGQRLLDKEILYQFYTDGSYIQYSHNYHRVAIQLATWYLVMAKKNDIDIRDEVIQRLKQSAQFLKAHIQPNGWLSNYGANDGALFFRWNNDDYRNFSGQLQAFCAAIDVEGLSEANKEDVYWYGLEAKMEKISSVKTVERFDETGFYVLRKKDLTVYIRCGNHLNRPSQADNLHLDVWYKGKNILWDTGSYKYNTSAENIRFYWGTKGHNTVQLDDEDQMLKGSRFLWHYWSKTSAPVHIHEEDSYITFEGTISAFRCINSHIKHQRKLRIEQHSIYVEDTLIGKPPESQMVQNWHVNPELSKLLTITSNHPQKKSAGYCSNYYGVKDDSEHVEIVTKADTIKTTLHFS